ncbi:MAG: hypothetical protein PVJ86_04830, partial [Phycisphaerales bacterium]
MSYTQLFSEDAELLAVIACDNANAAVGEHNSGYVFVGDYHRILILVITGEVGAAGSTLDIDVEEATDAAATGAQNVTGIAPAQLTNADAGDPVLIEFQTEDLTQDYDFINVECIVGTNTYRYGVLVFGFHARHKPVGVALWNQ